VKENKPRNRGCRKQLQVLEKEYAIVATAHRLSTVTNADQIYKLADGEIIENGANKEFISKDRQCAEPYTVESENQIHKINP
jgi:subfamily B ATP-binding cassette protein MsbA